MHRELFWFIFETVTISVYGVPFCLYMELTVAPLVAGTGNNTNPVLLKVKIAYMYPYDNVWAPEINLILWWISGRHLHVAYHEYMKMDI